MDLRDIRSEARSISGLLDNDLAPDLMIDNLINRAQMILVDEGELLTATATANSVADQERYELKATPFTKESGDGHATNVEVLKIKRVAYVDTKLSRVDINDIPTLDIS